MSGQARHDMGEMGEMDDDDMMMMMSMQMTFTVSSKATILFDGWSVDSAGGMIGSCVGIFVFACLYEGLKYLREVLFYRASVPTVTSNGTSHNNKDGEGPGPGPERTTRSSILNTHHVLQTVLHLLQVFVSYILMLIVMTYNVWLILAVVLGATCGYFMFGWIRQSSLDTTEHCN